MAISLSMVSVILIAVSVFFLVLVRPVWQQIPRAQHLKLQTAHDLMLIVLLVLLVLIVFVGHALLRRMLEPLRSLNQGVAALGEGNFEVTVPVRHQDELGALSDAFNKMVSRVGEMVNARDQLLLDVSHELRSPLTRMKVALELCENDEHIEKLKSTVIEMEMLVAELLELERLRHGRGLKLERQDLMEVLRDAIAAFAPINPGVRLEFAPPKVFLWIDADKIRSVFGNLLENACKYAAVDSQFVRVKVREMASSIAVEIVDDGPGIPVDDLPRIFEPFFRVDRSRSKKTGGYGLGLSLCKRIMEAHGGNITVRNNSQRGTTFELTFSLVQPVGHQVLCRNKNASELTTE
jgi:signal transduction histidine kinase